MIRVVLDTNVLVSALFSPAGFEDRVLKLALRGDVQLYLSPPILAEYSRVLGSSKFGFGKARVLSVLRRIRNSTHMAHPVRTLKICPHEDDNRFLECADVAGADYIVTGNKRHFPLQFKQTDIVNAREFLERVFPHI